MEESTVTTFNALFYPENSDSISLRNVDKDKPKYTVLRVRREKSKTFGDTLHTVARESSRPLGLRLESLKMMTMQNPPATT
jgi:hypothetical protein